MGGGVQYYQWKLILHYILSSHLKEATEARPLTEENPPFFWVPPDYLIFDRFNRVLFCSTSLPNMQSLRISWRI